MMRRKSERTATKKAKTSPEKKIEKPKRTRSRRKKHSSSENESADEASPEPAKDLVDSDVNMPQAPVKEDSPEEAQDQVWRVKAPEGSGDAGEIQKLKICLTRPPSTPERPDRSPRSKRKQTRATSSSDPSSVEGSDEKKKSRHRSKRLLRESKDSNEVNQDSQEEELETEAKVKSDEPNVEVSQSENVSESENITSNAITTSNDEKQEEKADVDSSENVAPNDSDTKVDENASNADTTVASSENESNGAVTTEPQSTTNIVTEEKLDHQVDHEESKTAEPESPTEPASPTRRRSASVDKSEILELHPEDSKCELDLELEKSKLDDTANASYKAPKKVNDTRTDKSDDDKNEHSSRSNSTSPTVERHRRHKISENESSNHGNVNEKVIDKPSRSEEDPKKTLERSNSVQSQSEEPQNGPSVPFTVNRKRKWGKPSKLTTQKSLTISTEVLKEIIPDVKPTEFEEVIEDKKPKNTREREPTERVERPVLPKIVIDNTENPDRNIKTEKNVEQENIEIVVKPKELSTNRKISIIKENSDSIIARPPSPPRHKQSCVLYITNLVRPFTLPQLKNLLQRTGKIVENGFWIDKIKSKCFVIYENEDQAVETRHALHGVTWPVSNPKTLQVDFSTEEALEKAKVHESTEKVQINPIPGTVEDWLREQDIKKERGEVEKPWDRKPVTREWDLGKNEKDKEKERLRRDERLMIDKRRNRSVERSPEPARKFKKKEEEAPAKLLDDLFKKTKTTPCIYWLPLSAETIAIKEEQRRQQLAEHERRLLDQRRHRRH